MRIRHILFICFLSFLCSCDTCFWKNDSTTDSATPNSKTKQVTLAELLPKAPLKKIFQLEDENKIVVTLDESDRFIRYEWPLPQREKIQQVNQCLMSNSLSTGNPVSLFPESGVLTLSRRVDELSLVELQTRLVKELELESESESENLATAEQNHPYFVSLTEEISGLWCPVGKVLYFDSNSSSMTLGIKLGLEQEKQRQLVFAIAREILQLDAYFLTHPPQQEPEEESWIQPE